MTDEDIRSLIASIAEENKKTAAAQLKTEGIIDSLAEDRKKYAAELAEERKKTEAAHQKTEKEFAKLNQAISEFVSKTGNYIDNHSDVVEGFFVRGLKANHLKVGDIVFDYMSENLTRGEKGVDEMEIDGFLVNGDCVGYLETKTTLTVHKVREIVKIKLPRFRKLFADAIGGRKVLVIVAGEGVTKDARDLAHEHGFVVLSPDDDKIAIDASHSKLY